MGYLLLGAGLLGLVATLWASRHVGKIVAALPPSFQYQLYLTPLGYQMNLKGERETNHSLTSPIEIGDARIITIAIRDDNYAYLIIDKTTGLAAAVDPSDPKLVLKALSAEKNVNLVSILTTHKHWDHSGGNSRLLEKFPLLKVYGSAIDNVPSVNQPLYDNDSIRVGNLSLKALESSVHTKGHLLFLLEQQKDSSPPALFSGDAIFLGGAGKFFESKGEHLYRLVERLKGVRPDTLLFPGHEYSLSNLVFAQAVDPENTSLKQKLAWVKERRDQKQCTIPSTLEEEFSYNPFFRYDEEAIRSNFPAPPSSLSPQEVSIHYVSELRRQKDAFVPKPKPAAQDSKL